MPTVDWTYSPNVDNLWITSTKLLQQNAIDNQQLWEFVGNYYKEHKATKPASPPLHFPIALSGNG